MFYVVHFVHLFGILEEIDYEQTLYKVSASAAKNICYCRVTKEQRRKWKGRGGGEGNKGRMKK